ncbi:MAG: type II toxin-antitoxin system HicB family antitoxin, partial [Bacillota bacterium]
MEKNLEYYMALPYTVVLKPYTNGGFFAKIEELPGCMTEGDTREEALQMIEDAKRSWLSAALGECCRIKLREGVSRVMRRFSRRPSPKTEVVAISAVALHP